MDCSERARLPDQNSESIAQTLPCGKEVKEFIEHLASDAVLSECSIVLPQASNEGAHILGHNHLIIATIADRQETDNLLELREYRQFGS